MYRNILVPVDPSHQEVGPRLVEIAKKLVDDDGTITFISVIEPLPGYVASYAHQGAFESSIKANREAAMDALNGLRAKAGDQGKAFLAEGGPIPEILRIAEDIKADAIVLGCHRPDLRDYLIGSTAARVVRHAQCTVIVERSTEIIN